MSVPTGIHVRVQHHPARAELLARLTPRLRPYKPSVVVDPGGDVASAWRCYRQCLVEPWDGDRLLIVQDDAWPATGFAKALKQIVVSHPDSMVALFMAGAPWRTKRLIDKAAMAGRRYASVHPRDFPATVALLWPRADAEAFVSWTDEHPPTDPESGDDNVVGEFMRKTNRRVVVTVPSIVQHPDDVPSMIGRRHANGRNRFRVAAVFYDGDVSRLDW